VSHSLLGRCVPPSVSYCAIRLLTLAAYSSTVGGLRGVGGVVGVGVGGGGGGGVSLTSSTGGGMADTERAASAASVSSTCWYQTFSTPATRKGVTNMEPNCSKNIPAPLKRSRGNAMSNVRRIDASLLLMERCTDSCSSAGLRSLSQLYRLRVMLVRAFQSIDAMDGLGLRAMLLRFDGSCLGFVLAAAAAATIAIFGFFVAAGRSLLPVRCNFGCFFVTGAVAGVDLFVIVLVSATFVGLETGLMLSNHDDLESLRVGCDFLDGEEAGRAAAFVEIDLLVIVFVASLVTAAAGLVEVPSAKGRRKLKGDAAAPVATAVVAAAAPSATAAPCLAAAAAAVAAAAFAPAAAIKVFATGFAAAAWVFRRGSTA
jgi:hypothetical protein